MTAYSVSPDYKAIIPLINPFSECIATHGSPAATYTAAASLETATATTTEGTGTTHTVIVAPTQGWALSIGILIIPKQWLQSPPLRSLLRQRIRR